MLSVNQTFDTPEVGNDQTHQQFNHQGLRHPPVQKQPLSQIPPSLVEFDQADQIDQPVNEKNNGSSQEFKDSEKKYFTKKQKYFIAVGILIALAVIAGGVISFVVIQSQKSGPQIPSTYPQYQSQIKVGQEKNLVEIIHVPKSQKIYEYVMVNDQFTAHNTTKATNTKSTITHKFALVCLNVTDASFDMILYFIESQVEGHSEQEVSTFTGYPKIKEVQKRLLRGEEQSSSNNSDESTLLNEYGFLTQKEIDILESKGISADQFYSSNLPIIRFTILKNGLISQIQQPLRIRYDIHQIYLNILDQISPIVLKDFYNVSNGKRLLSSQTQKNSLRILSNEIVDPTYVAQIHEDGNTSAKKSYETLNQKNDNQTRTFSNYDQTSNIQNGALLNSQVTSKFSMEDNLVDENDQTQPLFQQISLNSQGSIEFVSQADTMSEDELNTLVQDQEGMTVIQLSWDQALDIYNQVFNVSKQSSSVIDTESNSGRLLQAGKSYLKTVSKPIFRKTYASMEFGADIQSSCGDAFDNSGDICSVGLYSYFNGASIKLLEKNTTVNISKILKIYQYIANILDDKLIVVENRVQQSLDAVSNSLDDILNKVDYTISIDKNPILSQVKSIVSDDSLHIIAQIKQIESLVQTTLDSVNQLLSDPLNTLKNRTITYLERTNPSMKQQIDYINNFFTAKYAEIKDFAAQANKTSGGISAAIKEQATFILDHHTQIIADIIEKPASDAMNFIEQAILDNADKIFNNATLIDQFINQNITSMVQNFTNNINLTNLNLPLNNTTGLNITAQLSTIISQINGNDLIKQAVSDVIKSVANNAQLIDQLKDGLKQSLDTTKNQILSQIQQYQISNSTSPNDQLRINNITAEINSFVPIIQDIYSDVMEIKNNFTNITEQIKNIKSSHVLRVSIDLSTSLLGLPVDMAIKIKNDALQTADQIKSIGLKVYSDIMQWKSDLTQDSVVLLAQAKGLYNDIISFLKQAEFPDDDPKFYQKPIYDDVETAIDGVKQIMNFKFANITDKFTRIKNIPSQFQQFVVDLKTLYNSTLSFANQIKFTVTNPNFDTGLLGQYVQKLLANTVASSSTLVLSTVDAQIAQPVALQAAPSVLQQVDQLVNVSLMSDFTQIISGQQVDVKAIYKQLIHDLIANADFKQNIQFPQISLPIQYVYVYPTPIGVAIQLKLSAAWNTAIGIGFGVKNATLDLSASVNTQVVVTGSVSASILIAEVGGYAQGIFLDTNVTAGVHLEVFNNYKGSYYFDGSFNPFQVKVGIYYQYYDPLEITQCGALSNSNTTSTDDVKKSVQTVQATQTWAQIIASKLQSAFNCIKTLSTTPIRKDLFDPFTYSGQTYSKRLAEGDF